MSTVKKKKVLRAKRMVEKVKEVKCKIWAENYVRWGSKPFQCLEEERSKDRDQQEKAPRQQ